MTKNAEFDNKTSFKTRLAKNLLESRYRAENAEFNDDVDGNDDKKVKSYLFSITQIYL